MWSPDGGQGPGHTRADPASRAQGWLPHRPGEGEVAESETQGLPELGSRPSSPVGMHPALCEERVLLFVGPLWWGRHGLQ